MNSEILWHQRAAGDRRWARGKGIRAQEIVRTIHCVHSYVGRDGPEQTRTLLCIVETKDGDLGEQLVRNGLAGNYGLKAVPPGIKSSRNELEKLQRFENKARQEEIGAWGAKVGRTNVHAQAPTDFSSFVPEG